MGFNRSGLNLDPDRDTEKLEEFECAFFARSIVGKDG